MTAMDDVDMDANPDQPSLGTKELGNGETGAGVVSGKAGGDAGADGRASGVGEQEEAFPTRVADFFKPRPKGAAGSGAGKTNGAAKGKGKQTSTEDYLAGREGLPWYVWFLVSLFLVLTSVFSESGSRSTVRIH
jgi:hypothetical protein